MDLQIELVRRAREGDHDAFASLVGPEIHRLYGLAGLLLKHVPDLMMESLELIDA